MIHLHGNLRLAFNHVKIGDEIAVLVDEKSGAESLRCADLDNRLADLLDQFLHVARPHGLGIGNVKLRRIGAGQRIGSGDCAGERASATLDTFVMTLRGTTSTV